MVDGVVGDYLCQEFGDLQSNPLYIDIANGCIQHIHCDNQLLLKKFTAYVQFDENSNWVGEVAIGINTALKRVIGNILQDEIFPGIHIIPMDNTQVKHGLHPRILMS